jgi:hypothetical protein
MDGGREAGKQAGMHVGMAVEVDMQGVTDGGESGRQGWR